MQSTFLAAVKAFSFPKPKKQEDLSPMQGIKISEGVVTFTDFELWVSFPTPKGLENVSGIFSGEKIVKLFSKFKSIVAGNDRDALVFRAPGRLELKAYAPIQAFPSDLPFPDAEILYSGDYSELMAAVDYVSDCASTEDSRRYLHGIYFHTEDSVLVATDGRRLAKHKLPLLSETEGKIIPNKVFSYFKKMGKNLSGSIKVTVSGNHVQFQFENITITTATIDGTFPNYKQVIPAPESLSGAWSMSDKSMLAAVKNLSTMKYAKTNVVPIRILGNAAGVVVVSHSEKFSNEWGQFTYKATATKSEDIDIVMNTEFFLDAAKVIPQANLYFNPDNPLVAVKIAKNVADENYIIIMPMKK